MSDQPLARQLGEFATTYTYDRLPQAVRESVKQRVLDTLGICVRAAGLETSQAAIEFALEQGKRDDAHAIGVGTLLPASMAAFVNGVLAHSLDYDDTHLPSVLHPSATIVPAALACAEAVGADGSATIAAIANGLEACVRIGMAGYDEVARNSTFFANGQHATSICGAMGAAVSVGMLLGFDAEGITNALGVTASMASGIIEANRTGGTVKRMHCGWAAHAALSACQLVKQGFSGPPTVFEGRFGFFQAWLHGNFDASAITEGLGTHWEVPGIFFKPYPANHFTHTAIDAARELTRKGVKPKDIERLVLGVAGPIVHTIGEPIDVKQHPVTPYMAQFSGPYAVVVGLLGGGGLGASLADYSEALISDPERVALMEKVSVVADERCSEIFPRQFPSVLRAFLRDGSDVEVEVLSNRGGSERPLSAEELGKKFLDNVESVLSGERAAEAVELIARLESVQGISEVFELLTF